jgi:hypothetical protein
MNNHETTARPTWRVYKYSREAGRFVPVSTPTPHKLVAESTRERCYRDDPDSVFKIETTEVN